MRARYYSPQLMRFVNADPIGFAGGLNHYAYANGNPVMFSDPTGLSTTRITSVDGKVTVLVDPSNAVLRDTIAAYPNASISRIEIVGHGGPPAITVGPGSDGDGIIADPGIAGGRAVYSDNLASFSDSVSGRMAQTSSIHLNGCNTASYSFVYDDKNIAKQISSELPTVVVSGNHGFALSNEVSLPWNRDKYFRIGSENHAIGTTFDYVGGKRQGNDPWITWGGDSGSSATKGRK